ncbi:hypothetical protein V8F06_005304 [Rhypophila decipiens]
MSACLSRRARYHHPEPGTYSSIQRLGVHVLDELQESHLEQVHVFHFHVFLVYPLDRLGSTSVRRSRYPARRPLRKRGRCGNLYATCCEGREHALESTLGIFHQVNLEVSTRSPIRFLFIPTKGPSSVKPGPRLVHLEHKAQFYLIILTTPSPVSLHSLPTCTLSLVHSHYEIAASWLESTSAATVLQCSHLTRSWAHIQQADGTARHLVPGLLLPGRPRFKVVAGLLLAVRQREASFCQFIRRWWKLPT